MNPEEILAAIRAALQEIDVERLFATERGYQGEFLAVLKARLPIAAERGILLEQEHQKRLADHGIKIRPDIIIHEPFSKNRHRNRTEGNYAVLELKRNASDRATLECLSNLSLIMNTLDYPLGVFVNIDSDDTKANVVANLAPARRPRGRLAMFAVARSAAGEVRVSEEQPRFA